MINLPYWFELQKLRVGRENDRRRKLSDEEINAIIELRASGFSIRKLAKMFKVDRNTIKWHTSPEFRKREYERKRRMNYYYNREKHRLAVKRYREHLKEIYGLRRWRLNEMQKRVREDTKKAYRVN